MTCDELILARRRLSLTQADLAHLLGVHRITILRWESGEWEIPAHYRLDERLLRYAEKRLAARR